MRESGEIVDLGGWSALNGTSRGHDVVFDGIT